MSNLESNSQRDIIMARITFGTVIYGIALTTLLTLPYSGIYIYLEFISGFAVYTFIIIFYVYNLIYALSDSYLRYISEAIALLTFFIFPFTVKNALEFGGKGFYVDTVFLNAIFMITSLLFLAFIIIRDNPKHYPNRYKNRTMGAFVLLLIVFLIAYVFLRIGGKIL